MEEKIREFLKKETQRSISDDAVNLIQAGVLDSFSMIKLIAFIETDFGVSVPMEDLTPENFNSVSSIAEKIRSWQR